MTFKKKSIILFTFIFCLALLYAAAVIFNTNGAGPQNSEYSWMDRKYIDYADRIEIYGPSSNFILVKRNNIWLMQDSGSGNNVYYPVKQARPQDLLSDLCRPGVYPVRSYSSSVQDVYGLGENASHIIVRGGAGPPLLDLLIGSIGRTGSIFLRKIGLAEVRTGNDIFSIYTDNDKTFWYDLRIFPGLEADMIQRVHLNNNEKSLTLSRVKNAWINEDTGLVFTGAEPLIRSILDSQAENFFDTAAAVDATNATDAAAATDTTESTIILELGNSGQLYLIIGKPDSSGACPARISNSELIYSISEWTVNKIFSYF